MLLRIRLWRASLPITLLLLLLPLFVLRGLDRLLTLRLPPLGDDGSDEEDEEEEEEEEDRGLERLPPRRGLKLLLDGDSDEPRVLFLIIDCV